MFDEASERGNHTSLNIELEGLNSTRTHSTILRFPSGYSREAKVLGKVGSDAYRFLCKKFHVTPPFELVVLSEAKWKEAFGSQPYGDPVTPGDGRIYYGTKVPESWRETVALSAAAGRRDVPDILTPTFFRRTLAHEVGHLFSNMLMGTLVRERMGEDFSSGNLEILWFVETFSQYCQFSYLDESRDLYRLRWLRLYHEIFDSLGPRVRYRRLTEWGTRVIRQMRTDLKNALLNYTWMQAKSYLMCEERNREAGSEVLPALASVLKRMSYPIANDLLLKKFGARASWFQDIFGRWNTA